MNRDSRLADYLRQMIDGSRDALSFTDGLDRDAFMDDLRTQRAVVMNLMIGGEPATRTLSEYPDFAEGNRGIPWRSIRGMRNRIAHGYFDVDLGVVWSTVQSELPRLVERLERIQT